LKEITAAVLFLKHWRGCPPLQTLVRGVPPPKTPPLVQIVVFLAVQIKKDWMLDILQKNFLKTLMQSRSISKTIKKIKVGSIKRHKVLA
jgi:hypothetical protein